MINRLFSTVVANVGSNIQDTSTPMQTIIKRFSNDAYFEILRRFNWDTIDPDYSFPTVAGTQDYVLPNNFKKEIYLYDTTNLRYIPYISLAQLVEKFPESISTQGLVEQYTIFPDVVRTQPTSASTLSIVSSSASDTTQQVRVKGTDSNDVEIEESVTLTGTVAAVTTNSYKEIRSISKSATTVGRITITSNSGVVTNAILSLTDLDYKVTKIRLHSIPNSVITYKLPYHINPYPLVNDMDTPIIDCAEGIELGATMRAWRYKRQFQKAQEFERLFEKWINDVIWDKENQPNRTNLLNPKPYSREDF